MAEEDEFGKRPESLSEVLASIRALVSAETSARMSEQEEQDEDVLMLTSDMRLDSRPGAAAFPALGLGDAAPRPQAGAAAPILDEEGLRGMINAIVREELRGELGERISRDLRKIVRREVEDALRAERERDA
ncbi:MAG: hypothetical protein DI556_21150 [Rhodovulum sulfidophilum]|uniref:Uncharacterized protein n=1 Tax=Rhodovulum sulfidophilum TaxID=35806 RepID=A0A2W5Q459_RHOSU|nr:MAG: hypothetical protein DI556_21150 [Rhodovulum sulfidophilum]